VPKLTVAVLLAVAVALALTLAPVRAADTATADDTAHFLAGLPPAADSPLAALAGDARWQRHARYFDAIFEREEATTLSRVRAFAQEHLADKHDTMLYMFSGPDLLYATSFFPNASTYVLAGLEPVGDVPQLTALKRPFLEYTLQNIESSIGTLMNYSFFITHNMKTQLSAGPVYGTLPILYVFFGADRQDHPRGELREPRCRRKYRDAARAGRPKRGQDICPKRGQRSEDRLFGRRWA
jgi:hypothetical protein